MTSAERTETQALARRASKAMRTLVAYFNKRSVEKAQERKRKNKGKGVARDGWRPASRRR